MSCIESLMCPDTAPQPDFPCAVLGCEPDFRDWAGELANRRCEGGPNDHGECATDDDCPGAVCEGTTTACMIDEDCAENVSCVAYTCTRSAPLHVFGEGVVPARSAYDVTQIPFGCDGDVAGCGFRSPKLLIITARWGDLDDNGLDASDIALASNKLKEIAAPGALTKPRVMLVGSLLRPYRNVNVLELQNTIDPLASVPQPTGQIKGPQSCPSD
ncbi:MAG: hypothetical protein IID35_08500 [Planctomycetes bacterium]|nr:hypothetical protein [Planctomycetota bacterium]